MYLQPYKYIIFSCKGIREVFEFSVQILEVICSFVFSVTGASRVKIGNHDRCWKAGSERFLVTVTRSAYVHNQFG